MKYILLLLALVAVNSHAQFAPEKIQTGLAIVFPNDMSAQTAFLTCLNRMYSENKGTPLKAAGLHGLHLLSRLSSTPEGYHQLMLSPLHELSKSCATPQLEPDADTLNVAKLTNVFTFPRGGKITRTPDQIKFELCININQAKIGLLPRKIQSHSDLSSNEKQMAAAFCGQP